MITIMLVDDHKMMRQVMSHILGSTSGLQVIAEAENGEEAVLKNDIYHPDVILMDVNMPRMNGIEATKIIKQKSPLTCIIGVSNFTEKYVKESMKEAGAHTFWNKGNDVEELVEEIIDCVQNH